MKIYLFIKVHFNEFVEFINTLVSSYKFGTKTNIKQPKFLNLSITKPDKGDGIVILNPYRLYF